MRARTLALLLVATAVVATLLTVPTLVPWPGTAPDRPSGIDDADPPPLAEDDDPATDAEGPGSSDEEPAQASDPEQPRRPAAEAAETTIGGGEAPAPAEASISDALAARLADITDSPAVAEEDVGLIVVDRDGVPIVEVDADRPLLPASTQKLVTAAAALRSLGPDFRYATTVRATARPDGDGVVDGDLVLVGSGDPTLVTPVFATAIYPARPSTSLEALADGLVDAGVTRVTGSVVGDPTVFADEPVATGWLTDYFHTLDATRVSGLTVDAGRRIFERNGRLLAEVADRPAGVAAGALRDLLEERDVRIEGTAGTTRQPPQADHLLARVASPPLHEILLFMVQRSDNHLADAIHRTVGSQEIGVGSWTGGAAAALSVLDDLGVDWAGAVIADGSGLSRDDRLTARQLATLDAAMTASEDGELWTELMAVAGESGTLQGRLRGTLADGRMRGKTGTLRDVRSLAGVVLGPDGGGYHFAVLGNGLDGAGIPAVRSLQDELVVALAEDLQGCERVPVDDDDDRAYELVCED